MFGGLYQDDTDRALAAEAESPRTVPKVEPGAFSGFGRALVTAVPAAGLEAARAGVNLLEAYGRAAAFREGAPKAESVDRMFEQQSEVSRQLGEAARSFGADPATSGAAAQVVHGFVKFGSKAAAYALTTGPFAPLLFGVDEGVNEGLRLADRGVDTQTALGVGAVHGLASAGAVALPLIGQTKLGTAGLVVAGGPGAFVGERIAAREILESAGYDRIAAEYDPWDVTGLLVSTLGPGALGAAGYAIRAARRGRAADAPPAGRPAEEPTVPREAADPEVVDAARVRTLDAVADDARLGRGGDPIAEAVHADAMARAEAAIREGRPVDVAAAAARDPEALAGLRARGLELFGDAARVTDPPAAGAVDAVGTLSPLPVEPAGSPRAPEAAARAGDANAAIPPQAGEIAPPAAPDAPGGTDTPAAGREAASGPQANVGERIAALDQRLRDVEIHQEDGTTMKAADMLRQLDEEVRATETDAKAFEAAVTCFLRVGA